MALTPLTNQQLFDDADPGIAYNRVFFALMRIQRTVMPKVEKALRDIGVPDPIWYEILLATDEAGPSGVPMIALQKRLFIPQYALSRHVARLMREGLITREATTGAGRGQRLFLAPKAKGMQEQIWQVYEAQIQEAFSPRMSPDEAYTLLKMLNRLYT